MSVESPVSAAPPPQAARRIAGDGLGLALARHQVWLMLLAVGAYLYLTEQNFGTVANLANVLLDCSFVGLLAIGLTPLLISRNIDLSVGAILGLAACITAVLSGPLGGFVAVVAALGAGIAVSLFNGLLVRILRLDSFIVTLAAMIGVRGLTFLVAGQESISVDDPRLTALGSAYVGPVSLLPIIAIVLALATQWILANTIHGRNSFAIGGSPAAAVNGGIRATRHVLINFAFAGFMAALAGVLMAANLGAANANFGRNYELWAIAAVVLGGTRLTGGVGNAVNAFAAALLLSLLRNGMNLKQVPSFYVLIVMGGALVAALLIDRLLSTRRAGGGPSGSA